jgi:hypothetical protein
VGITCDGGDAQWHVGRVMDRAGWWQERETGRGVESEEKGGRRGGVGRETEKERRDGRDLAGRRWLSGAFVCGGAAPTHTHAHAREGKGLEVSAGGGRRRRRRGQQQQQQQQQPGKQDS